MFSESVILVCAQTQVGRHVETKRSTDSMESPTDTALDFLLPVGFLSKIVRSVVLSSHHFYKANRCSPFDAGLDWTREKEGQGFDSLPCKCSFAQLSNVYDDVVVVYTVPIIFVSYLISTKQFMCYCFYSILVSTSNRLLFVSKSVRFWTHLLWLRSGQRSDAFWSR